MKQKLIALTALVGFALPMVAEENPKLIEAKKLLERAQTKHKIGEEAEAIDLGRAAAKLGSLEARVLVAGWLLERNAPKTKTKASKSLQQAANSETDAIHMIEQEIAALMKQSQQCSIQRSNERGTTPNAHDDDANDGNEARRQTWTRSGQHPRYELGRWRY